MTPELTPEFTDWANKCGWDDLERQAVWLVQMQGVEPKEAAAALEMTPARLSDELRMAHAKAHRYAQDNPHSMSRRYWETILGMMEGPKRHNPPPPALTIDRYASKPGSPFYKSTKVRSKYPAGEDFVPEPVDNPLAASMRRQIIRQQPDHPLAQKHAREAARKKQLKKGKRK